MLRVVLLMQTETGNQNNFDHVYTVVTLDEPSAQSIRDLENMMGMSCLFITCVSKSPSHLCPSKKGNPMCDLPLVTSKHP